MQDRLTYASGNTITTEGFRCAIGEPIDIKVTVGESEEVDLSDAAAKRINPGNYFITLEVNGEKSAYRDLYHLGENAVTIGDYTISDDLYLTGVSEDDEVVMRLEPVELTVTDAFRAAVGKVAPKSGGSGGVLAVENINGTLDHTWREIANAIASTGAALVVRDEDGEVVSAIPFTFCNIDDDGCWMTSAINEEFYAASPDDRPSLQGLGGGDNNSPVS